MTIPAQLNWLQLPEVDVRADGAVDEEGVESIRYAGRFALHIECKTKCARKDESLCDSGSSLDSPFERTPTEKSDLTLRRAAGVRAVRLG